MHQTNLVMSLLERERCAKRRTHRPFEEFLEYKTAINSNIHLTYHLPHPARSTFVITFSPDRTKIATSHGNHTVKVSNCFSCKVLCTLVGHLRTPWCVSFHPKINSILVSGCLGGQVRLWDLNNITSDNVIYSSQSVIASLTFHPVDNVIVIGTTNKIIFFEWNHRQILKTLQTKHHSESIRLVRFLPLGEKLLTGIANASTQYCKPTSLNVSTRGDPLSGQPVVQTVSCMRMQKRTAQTCDASTTTVISMSKKTKVESPKSSSSSCNVKSNDNKDSIVDSCSRNSECSNNVIETDKQNNECNEDNVNIVKKNARKNNNTEHSDSSTSTPRAEDKQKTNNFSSIKKNTSTENQEQSFSIQEDNTCTVGGSTDVQEDRGTDINSNSNDDHTQNSESTSGQSFTRVEREQVSLNRQLFRLHPSTRSSVVAWSSETDGDEDTDENEAESHIQEEQIEAVQNALARYRGQSLNATRQVRSEIWNFTLGGAATSDQISTPESLHELDVSVEGAASTIPVHGFVTFPASGGSHSASISNLGRQQAQTAVATATARSSHHVHTAVVIASQDERSDVALQTAVNRAIAGAFAGSGEGAVANNIIDTTHRLQLWDSNDTAYPETHNETKNVVVPFCKIHNDSSVDVSQDGALLAVFVPSEQGFPMDAQLQIISLKPDSYLQCVYSRKYGPNAVSVSLSPLNRFVLIGLASRKLHWQLTAHQLVGQILKLPGGPDVIHADSAKPIYNLMHKCNQTQRSNVSVNTVRFHPSPGMGILYGTNRGHVQHCHIGPSLELMERKT